MMTTIQVKKLVKDSLDAMDLGKENASNKATHLTEANIDDEHYPTTAVTYDLYTNLFDSKESIYNKKR